MRSPRLTRELVREANEKLYIVPVATACNAACVFCTTMSYAPPPKPSMAEPSRLLAGASLAATFGVNRFEITGGGEPSLHPQLAQIVRELRLSHPASHIKIYTNGTRLGDYLAHADDVVISRCAVDIDENQKLMRISGGSPGLPDTVRLIRNVSTARVRLSIPLIRGGVESIDAALSFALRCADLVDGLVFRPLYPGTPNRDQLDPRIDTAQLSAALANLDPSGQSIEVDNWGCFRSVSLILSASGDLFSDWGMIRKYAV